MGEDGSNYGRILASPEIRGFPKSRIGQQIILLRDARYPIIDYKNNSVRILGIYTFGSLTQPTVVVPSPPPRNSGKLVWHQKRSNNKK